MRFGTSSNGSGVSGSRSDETKPTREGGRFETEAHGMGLAIAAAAPFNVAEAGWHYDNPGPARREPPRKGKASHKQNARRARKGSKR